MNGKLNGDRYCPLCGDENQCRIANGCLYRGACWCEEAAIPTHILRYLAQQQSEPTCWCQRCLKALTRYSGKSHDPAEVVAQVQAEVSCDAAKADSYLDEQGQTVSPRPIISSEVTAAGMVAAIVLTRRGIWRRESNEHGAATHRLPYCRGRTGLAPRLVGFCGSCHCIPWTTTGRCAQPARERVSSARLENILRINPDLVIAFSDVQAGIVGQFAIGGIAWVSELIERAGWENIVTALRSQTVRRIALSQPNK